MILKKRSSLFSLCQWLLAASVLGFTVQSAPAQDDGLLFNSRMPEGQQSVSTNQLLTSRKARQETERARRDLICGHFDAAQKKLQRALESDPHYAIALAMQGVVNLQIGNIHAAAEAFGHAVKEDPSLGAAYVGAAIVLLAQGRYQQALVPLNRASGLLPGSWFVHLQSGLAYSGLHDAEAAIREAELAEKLAGSDSERRSGVAYLRAIAYAATKDRDRERQYLLETITRCPNGAYAAMARKELDRFQFASNDATGSQASSLK